MLKNLYLLMYPLPARNFRIIVDKLLLMHCGQAADINQQPVHKNKNDAAIRLALACRRPVPKQLQRDKQTKDELLPT